MEAVPTPTPLIPDVAHTTAPIAWMPTPMIPYLVSWRLRIFSGQWILGINTRFIFDQIMSFIAERCQNRNKTYEAPPLNPCFNKSLKAHDVSHFANLRKFEKPRDEPPKLRCGRAIRRTIRPRVLIHRRCKARCGQLTPPPTGQSTSRNRLLPLIWVLILRHRRNIRLVRLEPGGSGEQNRGNYLYIRPLRALFLIPSPFSSQQGEGGWKMRRSTIPSAFRKSLAGWWERKRRVFKTSNMNHECPPLMYTMYINGGHSCFHFCLR